MRDRSFWYGLLAIISAAVLAAADDPFSACICAFWGGWFWKDGL
jgi:hypothetical protein